MIKTRTESYDDMVETININPQLSTEDVVSYFLSEIAGSLAVIADQITEKERGDDK